MKVTKWWSLPGHAQTVVISESMARPLDILVKKPVGHHNLEKKYCSCPYTVRYCLKAFHYL